MKQRSRIFEHFPTPSFLEMPAIGLDISDIAIRYIELEKRHGRLFVKRWGEKPIPQGAITNGEIVNREALLKPLSELRDALDARFIHASLPEEKAYLFTTEIPRVEKKEIRGAIELLLEENVPIKPQEAIFDYEMIETGARDHMDVSVSVLPETTVDAFAALFDDAGFEPLVFVVDAQASMEALIKQGDMRTIFIVNVGAYRTTLSIVSRGVVYFTSTISVGGAALSAAIEKQLKVSPEEAEEKKRTEGLVGARSNMELFFSMVSALSVLRDEVNRLNSYWQNLRRNVHDLHDIEEYVFAGSDVAIPGFSDYFAMVVKAPVRLGNVWENACPLDEAVPPIMFEKSLDFATAVGLALPKTD